MSIPLRDACHGQDGTRLYADNKPFAARLMHVGLDTGHAPAADPFRTTRFTSTRGLLTKRLRLAADGTLHKTPAANMVEGVAEMLELADLRELDAVLSRATASQALGQGIAGSAYVRIVTERHEPTDGSAISRTRRHFKFPAGRGFMLLDHDGMPGESLDADELRRRIVAVVPELAEAPMLIRQSVSAGVRGPDGALLTGYGKWHAYVAVSDARLIPAAGKALELRLWAAGVGWFDVSAAGSALPRTLFDMAVFQPERLDFCAAPVLSSGLRQVWAPSRLYGDPASAFDLARIVVDDATHARAADNRAAARAAVEQRCLAQRDAWAAANAPKLARRRRIPVEQALAVLRHASERLELSSDMVLIPQHGAPVTVAELLADPARWDGARFADPLTPDRDRRVAVAHLATKRPTIYSHKHGGVLFSLTRELPAVAHVLDDAQAVEHVELHKLTPAEPPVDVQALVRVKLTGKLPAWLSRLASAGTEKEAALLAWSIGANLSPQVPVTMSLEAVVELLREHRPAVLRDDTFNRIAERLERRLQDRRQRALSFVTLPASVAHRHSVEVLDKLPKLGPEDYSGGVILLHAYMGSGKTKTVGKPFSEWAQRQADGRFLALCHRQSLARELATVTGCANYSDIPPSLAWTVRGMATCLPSIVKGAHQQIVGEAEYLFFDEITQGLRSLASGMTVADNQSPSDVYARLVERVSNARCIIGADAGMDARTLAFIEACRPGERFRIVRVPPPQLGLQVSMGYGNDALATAYGEMLARLDEGQRLVISCGEKLRAKEVERVLTSSGRRVLLLHGGNKENAEQAAFWRNPEAVSLEYDVVVHTSVISSGLSIEHVAAGPWFDHGFFIGSGASTTPADAVQMLRRVRYLTSWTVAVTPNHRHDIDNSQALLAGMQEAARDEGLRIECSDFDRFVAGVQADEATARADFAAGLWWVLQEQGFEVGRMELVKDMDHQAQLAELRAELRAERDAAILNAEDLTDAQAQQLRDASSRTEAEEAALAKWRIRRGLGTEVVDAAAMDVWDNGRGPRRLDRFSAAVHGLAAPVERLGEHLTQRRFDRARVVAYQQLLDGIELRPGLRITELTDKLLARVVQHRFKFAFLGIVPAHWARHLRDGEDFPMPSYPVREVGEILRRMGLDTRRREGTATRTSTVSSLRGDRASAGETARRYWHEVTAASWDRTAAWAERRNARRSMVEVVDVQPDDAPVEVPLPVEDALVLPAAHLLPRTGHARKFAMGGGVGRRGARAGYAA